MIISCPSSKPEFLEFLCSSFWLLFVCSFADPLLLFFSLFLLLYASVVSYLICMFVMYVLYVCCCCWCSSCCCKFCSCRCRCCMSWSFMFSYVYTLICLLHLSEVHSSLSFVCLMFFWIFLCPIKFYANYLHYKIWLVLQTILLIQVMSTPFCYCFVNHQYSHMLFIIVTSITPQLTYDLFRGIIWISSTTIFSISE